MAFFKFRKSNEEPTAPAQAPESAQTLRQRARHRLAGAAALVLLGVVGFPLLFDNQPRPIALDISIEIPDKAQTAPLAAVAASAAVAPLPGASRAASGVIAAAPAPSPSPAIASAPAPQVPVAQVKADAKSEVKAAVTAGTPAAPIKPIQDSNAGAPPAASKSAEAAVTKDAKPTVAQDAKPAAAKDAKPAPSDEAGRYIVQFGAFLDASKAREARQKVERAGLKTYAQVVQVPEGKKIRVRVGPFATRAEAEKAAEKIKKLNLPAAILTL
jgi:DedD protein